jgi:Peptidase family M20/M25/M40
VPFGFGVPVGDCRLDASIWSSFLRRDRRTRLDGVKLDVEEFQEGHPSGSSDAEPLARALATHVRAITGKAPRFEMCPGLLEIRFYARQGLPAYAYGPGLLSIAHGPQEFVHTSRIVECAAIYARVAASMLKPAVSRSRCVIAASAGSFTQRLKPWHRGKLTRMLARGANCGAPGPPPGSSPVV